MQYKTTNQAIYTLLVSFLGLILVHPVFATPTQFGSTGLVSVPTAETIDSGNFSAGLWGNQISTSNGRYFVLPATITMGMGSFIEVYGSYPNVLFNSDENFSDRNSADLGMKVRLYGKRTSNFKIAADGSLQRRISDNQDLNGKTDIGGRLILSYKTDWYGAHAYGGYISKKLTDDEVTYGAALELSINPRSKIFTEVIGSRYKGDMSTDLQLEGSAGAQYFLTPYLSMSLSGGTSFSDYGPDWRFIFGLSTSTGLGGYIKPIPKLESEIRAEEAKNVVIKPVKIIPISPRLVKTPEKIQAVSKIEVPLEVDKEEVIIRTYGQIVLPPQNSEATRPFIPPPPVDSLSETDNIDSGEKIRNADELSPTFGINLKGDSNQATTDSPVIEEKLVAYRRFRFPDVVGYFQQGKTELTSDARKQLADMAEQIRGDKDWAFLRIDAYTDSIGSQKYNTDLSIRRAIEVASHLINVEGIDPSRLYVRGMGASKQLADNRSEEGRKQNRRFEIIFLQREKRP